MKFSFRKKEKYTAQNHSNDTICIYCSSILLRQLASTDSRHAMPMCHNNLSYETILVITGSQKTFSSCHHFKDEATTQPWPTKILWHMIYLMMSKIHRYITHNNKYLVQTSQIIQEIKTRFFESLNKILWICFVSASF